MRAAASGGAQATQGVTNAQSEQSSEVGLSAAEGQLGIRSDPITRGTDATADNGKRATGAERRHGWLGGKGSEG